MWLIYFSFGRFFPFVVSPRKRSPPQTSFSIEVFENDVHSLRSAWKICKGKALRNKMENGNH